MKIGINYIALAFAADFLGHPITPDIRYAVAYGPFAVLVVAAFLLRFAAFARPLAFRAPRAHATPPR
jgi:hypothetical protein